MFATSAQASEPPGWGIAKASAHLEFHLRLVAPDIITEAQHRLRLSRQLGASLEKAEADLRLAKAGLETEHASCLGLRVAPGGYASFKCKLILSDDLGFHGKATGTWARNPASGRWLWTSTTFTLTGYAPPGWFNR
jgi:hypothetical protein